MRLQLVATVGPATAASRVLERVLLSADRVRLNAAHLSLDELGAWLERLGARPRHGRPRPVVVDLQGAKMRIGEIPSLARLPDRVTLVLAGASTVARRIPVPHPALFEAVSPGETLDLDDGRVRLQVVAVRADRIEARVTTSGPLSARKGINRPCHPIPCGALSADDLARVELAGQHRFVQFAFSFVHTGREAALLRARTGARLVAKIERPEAISHLRAIDSAFDEIWFCRGDLGVQAGIERIGALQTRFERRIPGLGRPAHLAGQVLEHMTRHGQPTRSEVVHLHDVSQRGWAGIVLSDETAIGDDPGAVCDLLDRLGVGARRESRGRSPAGSWRGASAGGPGG